MEPAEKERKQKTECYNCYRLIPSDSKFCPYCGHNQLERSGYTLRSNVADVTPQPPQPTQPQPSVPPYAYATPPQQGYSGYSPYRQQPSMAQRSAGVDWVDVAKYGGVIGTLFFVVLLIIELVYALYGFTYIPQMNTVLIKSPFYFITPFFVGVYAISGPWYGIIYVLCVIAATVSLAYVLKTSGTFTNELRLKSRGIQSSTLFLVGTMVMAYYFISVVVELVLLGTGTPVTSPDFAAAPWYMNVWGFVFAPVWEEIAARVLLIGLPLLIVAFVSRSRDRPWWKYLAGGNFAMKPIPVFFLILSSVMFGLGHWLAGSGWGLWKIFPATLAGLFMGFLFLKKGLFAAIIFHFGVDAQTLLLLGPTANAAVTDFVGVVAVIWVVVGAIFFIYYLLLAMSHVFAKELLPQKVMLRYSAEAATLAEGAPSSPASASPPQQYAPGDSGRVEAPRAGNQPDLHPYRPAHDTGATVMRDPHAPVHAVPGEPVFGYMCSRCGSLEAKYKDGKFVCVYCGQESDR